MRNRAFDWSGFLKQLASIAIPVALQNMLTTTGSMIDTMMIAQLGEQYVGAVGLCAQFTSLMFSCYWGFVGGGMLFYAQFWGAGDDDGVNRSYGMTLVCMMTVSVIFTLLGSLFPAFVMNIYTDKAAIQSIGVDYLRVVCYSFPLQVFSMAMSALLRSTGYAQIPLYAAIASVGANVLFNWLLIGGNLGFPAMGVRGAALATVLAAAVNAAVCLGLARRVKHKYLFSVKRHFRWNRDALRLYFKKCFPILMDELLMGVGNAIVSIIIGRQSEQAIAAIAVFRTLEGLVIGFFAGFSNAASVMVGNRVGSGELEQAYERAKRIIYLCSATVFAVCLTLYLTRAPILRAMGLSDASYVYGSQLLLVYIFGATTRMGNWAQIDSFRSAGNPTFCTVLEISMMYALVLPATYLSGIVLQLPFYFVFICTFIDEPVRYVLMQLYFYSGKWVNPVTPQGRAALPAFMEKRNRKKKQKKGSEES